MSGNSAPQNAEPPSPESSADRSEPTDSLPAARSRRFWLRVAAVALATFLSLAVCELLLRLFWSPPEFFWHRRYELVADPFTGARYAANLRRNLSFGEKGKRYTFTINSMGYRGREFSFQKTPGAFRVLFVGDSFTEGFGVNDDQSFPAWFEALARSIAPNIEIINGGQSGTDLPEYLGFMRGYAERLSPDLVVLSLYAGNDVPVGSAPGAPPRYAMAYGLRVEKADANRLRNIFPGCVVHVRDPGSILARLDRGLHRASWFYQLASDGVLGVAPCRSFFRFLRWIEVYPSTGPTIVGRPEMPAFLVAPQPDVEERIAEAVGYLREIKAICDRLGAGLFIQIIPYPFGLPGFEPLWDHLAAEWKPLWEKRLGRPIRDGDVDKNRINEIHRRAVAQAGLDCMDLTTYSLEAARDDRLYRLTFAAAIGHFTPQDNLWDALLLLQAVSDRKMLPERLPDERILSLWRSRFPNHRPPFATPEP